MNFTYFVGPVQDMAWLHDSEQQCMFCGKIGPTFELQDALMASDESEKENKFGCLDCLQNGIFEFWHDTEVGVLDEKGLTKVYAHNKTAPPNFSDEALVSLKRTPQILTWQQEFWLCHCNDFMVYQGTWEPADFYRNAADGDGRKLFYQMTDYYPNLWDDSVTEGQDRLERWHATYYVFKCRHCESLRGYWDCD